MGGRKFRLSTYRKNEERRKAGQHYATQPTLVISIPQHALPPPPPSSLTVTLPIASYVGSRVDSAKKLGARLGSSLTLPQSWMVTSKEPLNLCKLRVQVEGQVTRPEISMVISIQDDLRWTLFVSGKQLSSQNCPLLDALPIKLTSVNAVSEMMSLIDSSKFCAGNPEKKFLNVWHHRSMTLCGSLGKSNVHMLDLYVNYSILHLYLCRS